MTNNGTIRQQGVDLFLEVRGRTFRLDVRQHPIGEGAMGIVYVGYDIHNKEKVAIKRIKDKFLQNQEIRQRAQQEAELSFAHPNLVEMIGIAQVNAYNGPIFLVSKFVNGVPMNKFVQEKVLQLPRAEHRICEMFLPIFDALSFIHSRSIIHMDIKPSNIMVENDRNVRLMDLGIANVSAVGNNSTSGMMGTPNYAAPEQFDAINENPTLSASTDIYEAGVTLYELLTSENPFKKATIADIKEAHRNSCLPNSPKISPAIMRVLQKATEIKPTDRYQSAAEMKTALQQALLNPSKQDFFDKMKSYKNHFFDLIKKK